MFVRRWGKLIFLIREDLFEEWFLRRDDFVQNPAHFSETLFNELTESFFRLRSIQVTPELCQLLVQVEILNDSHQNERWIEMTRTPWNFIITPWWTESKVEGSLDHVTREGPRLSTLRIHRREFIDGREVRDSFSRSQQDDLSHRPGRVDHVELSSNNRGKRRPEFICEENDAIRNAKSLLEFFDQLEHLRDIVGSQSDPLDRILIEVDRGGSEIEGRRSSSSSRKESEA